jgi:DNA-binding response OmpR family regulator
MSRVLIVEDEEHLAAGLRFNLEAEGYDAVVAGAGEAAIEILDSANGFDLVVLDVMLPGIDGFEVVKRLREGGNYMPVLMLTARGQSEDVLRGLSAGADDYLPKPFDLPILVARIQGLLRRKEWARKQETEGQAEPAQYVFGDNRLDFERQLIARDGAEQPLTLMEVNLLRHFIRNEGRNVSRKALLEEVWGVREDTDTRAIDNFVVRLRRYIEVDPAKPKHLLTVRGVGYRFVAEPADSVE